MQTLAELQAENERERVQVEAWEKEIAEARQVYEAARRRAEIAAEECSELQKAGLPDDSAQDACEAADADEQRAWRNFEAVTKKVREEAIQSKVEEEKRSGYAG